MSRKSVFGLSENIAGLFCYAFWFVSGIVILVMERENKFVRFHALQSVIWFVLLTVVQWILGFLAFLPFIGILSWAVGVLCFASWIYLMYMAFKGNKFKLPMIGDVVEAQIEK